MRALYDHSIEAEQAVLGALLIDEHAIDAMPELKPEWFWLSAHQEIAATALRLSRERKPLDPVMVHSALEAARKIPDPVPADMTFALAKGLGTAGNVAHYAGQVRKLWALRQARIVAARFASNPDLDDAEAAIGALQRDLAAIECGKSKPKSMLELTAAYVEELQRDMSNPEARVAFETGYTLYDKHTGGLRPGVLTVLAGRPGNGKAQPLSARILTPTGWRRMGDLAVGNEVIGRDGKPHRLTGVFDRGARDVFRVMLSDGGSTVCCDEHLWLTRTRSDRRRGVSGTVKRLSEIRTSLRRADSGGLNHSVPFMEPAHFAAREVLPVDPWLLGVYLGDGDYPLASSARIANPEVDIRRGIEAALSPSDELSEADELTVRVRRRVAAKHVGSDFGTALESLGLRHVGSHERFIPGPYLYASIADRIRLLQGLCDTDGYVQPCGTSVEYVTTSQRLRDDVVFLVGSLGGRATWSAKPASYVTEEGERRRCRTAYRLFISFANEVVPVSSAKHRERYRPATRLTERFIASVEPAGREECRCIAIDGDEHLYVTDDFIVTHNTAFVMGILAHLAKTGVPCAAFWLEDDWRDACRRYHQAANYVPAEQLRGSPTRALQAMNDAAMRNMQAQERIFLDDAHGLTVHDITARMRRLAREHGVKVFFADHLGEIRVERDDRWGDRHDLALGRAARAFRDAAKDLGAAPVLVSQMNRQQERRSDPTPKMSDLDGSGQVEQAARVIAFLSQQRDAAGEPTCEFQVDLAKNTNGKPGLIKLRWVPERMSVENT